MNEFEVTDYYEMSTRGAFILGHIRLGKIAPGMSVETGCEPATLRIVGVECLDDLKNSRHWNALIFAEKPSMEFLKRAFPIGSLVRVNETVALGENSGEDCR